MPHGDLLLCSGDFTMFSRSLRAIVDFNDWLGELPFRHRVVVPGNHETFVQTDPSNRALLDNAIVLINEGVEIQDGLRIWGTPVNAGFGPAFGVRSAEERRRLYAKIPGDTDILITHGPPFGHGDCDPPSNVHLGDPELFEAVERVRPRLHLFGHIHGGYGIYESEHTTFVNAALLGPGGDIDKEPIVIRMTRP
jgi:Icc-related predicted phosphoesterase